MADVASKICPVVSEEESFKCLKGDILDGLKLWQVSQWHILSLRLRCAKNKAVRLNGMCPLRGDNERINFQFNTFARWKTGLILAVKLLQLIFHHFWGFMKKKNI